MSHPKMKQDFFKSLPSEIVIDILSSLPVRTIISCKCVQKSWLHLLETREFVKFHLSKSPPGLAMHGCGRYGSKFYKVYEFEDGFDVENHDLHHKLLTKFNLTKAGKIMGSVDGLLLLCNLSGSNRNRDVLYICNPITRGYINIHCPREFRYSFGQAVTYGFGSSKMSSQYKVVRIFQDYTVDQEAEKWQKSSVAKRYVYTLGTGSWRRLASCALLDYIGITTGVFVNGNLHWVVCDLGIGRLFLRISCFNLETEHFSTLSTHFPWNGVCENLSALNLFALRDCLGFCDSTSGDKIVIWLMKEYGVEESWTKEFVIPDVIQYGRFNSIAYPIKFFKDGDILLQRNGIFIYYSNKTKTIQEVDMFKLPYEFSINSISHTPSFLSLESFVLENVTSF